MTAHTIAMQIANENRQSYGIRLESVTTHAVTGRGTHNSGSQHLVNVWENRVVDGELLDPNNRPATEAHTVLMAAQATVIAAHPIARPERGDAIVIGDTVTLTVAGVPIGTYTVTAGQLSDPYLLPAAS